MDGESREACSESFFETDCEVFFVPTGTASNALALAALCQPFHGVFCHAEAHIHTDECGRIRTPPPTESRVIPLEGFEGKLEPDRVRQAVRHYRTTFTATSRACSA